MTQRVDHLEALYHEGMEIRDQWWKSYVANLNRLSRELGSARQFAIDMGHLIPKPMPMESHPMPNGHDNQGMPPPLPEQALNEDALDQEWFDGVMKQREQWRNGAV